MTRFGFGYLLTVLALCVCAAGFTAGNASAQSVGPNHPPTNINAASPAVSGTLVARPVSGEGRIPAACRDRDAGTINAAVTQHRGLVICTEEGKLVLLQLSASTAIYSRYWAHRWIGRLRDGDHINAWGILGDRGYLLNPTVAVQDTDLQEAFADSQDFIAAAGKRLTLYVLASVPQSPVKGIVGTVQGGKTQITLCNGQPGTWADLTQGMTIDITHSLFNRHRMVYLHTARVQVVSCH